MSIKSSEDVLLITKKYIIDYLYMRHLNAGYLECRTQESSRGRRLHYTRFPFNLSGNLDTIVRITWR